MFLSTLGDHGAAPALVKTLAFSEARLKMIAENVANATTPGYRAKQLDVSAFRTSLRKALDDRGTNLNKPLLVESGQQVHTDREGYLQVSPVEKPVENLLFHDGTNFSIEQEMADLAETGMSHALATNLLQRHYDGLRRAIRGV